jgi:hypothetical protein
VFFVGFASFSISLSGGKSYVIQFHRKAFSLFNSIRALNGLSSLNNWQAQINNLSHSARITRSAALQIAGCLAFV